MHERRCACAVLRRREQVQVREQLFGVGSSFLLCVLGTQMQTVRIAEHAIFLTDKKQSRFKTLKVKDLQR